MTAPSKPPAGALFARRYRIQRSIGEGGMGVVLAAVDEKTGVNCAIKLLSKQAIESDTTRLVREARALMLLQSPHVVRVFDVDESAEYGPYLVLEHLEGYDLGTLPASERMSPPRAAALIRAACTALAEAHAHGIVHRDIKPSNLFVAKRIDGSEVLKVLDFGISKLSETAEWHNQPTLTAEDGFLGSPQFISPEQLDSPRTVDGRSDLWSVGVVLFRLVTGSYPFHGGTIAELFSSVLLASVPTLAERGVDSPELQAILDRCLVRDLEKRWASATDLAEALAPLAAGTSDPAMVSVVRSTPRSAVLEAPTREGENFAYETRRMASSREVPSIVTRRMRARVASGAALAVALATALLAWRAHRSAHDGGGATASTIPAPSSSGPTTSASAIAESSPAGSSAELPATAEPPVASANPSHSAPRPAMRSQTPRRPPPRAPSPAAPAPAAASAELKHNPYL